MAAWIWILIAIGALVVLGLVVFGARRNREKTQRREQAQELRQKADTHTQQAEERERVAQEQVQQAKEARKVAAEVGARRRPHRPGRRDDRRERVATRESPAQRGFLHWRGRRGTVTAWRRGVRPARAGSSRSRSRATL